MNTIHNRKAICDALVELAENDKDVIVLCSDSRGSASLNDFIDKYPKQVIEVGIAEQDLVGVAAGMASCGKKTFAVSPASFISTRSIEQVKVDVAYSHTNVKLIGISGGVSYGALGMSHHSAQDIAMVASIPGTRVYLPSDRFQSKWLVKTIGKDSENAYIRVGRNPVEDVYDENTKFELNKAQFICEGKDVAIIACGEMVQQSVEAAKILKDKGISATVIDMYCVKPIDREAVIKAAKTGTIVTVEEHVKVGGLGTMVDSIVCEECPCKVVNITLPNEPTVSGTTKEVFAHYGLDGAGIAETVVKALGR